MTEDDLLSCTHGEGASSGKKKKEQKEDEKSDA